MTQVLLRLLAGHRIYRKLPATQGGGTHGVRFAPPSGDAAAAGAGAGAGGAAAALVDPSLLLQARAAAGGAGSEERRTRRVVAQTDRAARFVASLGRNGSLRERISQRRRRRALSLSPAPLLHRVLPSFVAVVKEGSHS